MKETDIIVIGAGASGLMCAWELAAAGNKVTVLEGRSRLGGRIHTISNAGSSPIEAGAEFVHGDLPLTKQLLSDADVSYREMKGELWRSENGVFVQQRDFMENLDLVVKRLQELKADISVDRFLDTCFVGKKYAQLQKMLRSYVEGYDAADTTRASAFALLRELSGEENAQYRLQGGYQKLVDYLGRKLTSAGCTLHIQTTVKNIAWQTGLVEVTDQNGSLYHAGKVVITVPLGILQSDQERIGHIHFSPAIPEVKTAIDSLGYGAVIKIVLIFDEPIWDHIPGVSDESRPGPAFVFSDAPIPTWWTQLPERNGMITGWLAGPKATNFSNKPNDAIGEIGLQSLSQIFNIPLTALRSRLVSSHVHNWSKDDFSLGAYSYETVDATNAKRIITEGVENTLFFAGEAYHYGPEAGTVEAALVSGQKTALRVLHSAEH